MKDTVFQQILKPLTRKLMNECVNRFESDRCYNKLKTFNHLKTMIFAHISGVKSLRSLEVALNSQKLGTAVKIRRSTLSDANTKRSYNCFFWILSQLLYLLPRKVRKDVNKVVRVLDSSPIQLKGLGYDGWAKQNATNRCQGLKLHAELDLALNSPTNIAISNANYNDSSMGKNWPIVSNTIYVFDKGYYDFNWWWSINEKKAFFVTRLKRNAAVSVISKKSDPHGDILDDSIIKLKNKCPRGKKINLYTDNLRQVTVEREGKTPLVLVTNLQNLPAESIAKLYKSRWDVELFFKWIKQNLKIKKFLGRSKNSVKIQLATAIISYLLVQIFKISSKNKKDLYLVLVWVRYNLHIRKNYIKNSRASRCYNNLIKLPIIKEKEDVYL